MTFFAFMKYRARIIVPLLALSAFPFAAFADLGQPSQSSVGLLDGSNQQVRVRFFSDGDNCYRVATAGVRTRNASTPTSGGTVTLPAGPTAANIVWAGLYWVILGDTFPTNAVTINGAGVAPAGLPVTSSPCWGEANAYAYFADVTGMVGGGANVVAGLDDSGILGVGPESEGASLVVIYRSAEAGACEIVVTDGNDLLSACGQQIDNPLPLSCGDGLDATVYFIGADAQTDPTYTGFDDNQLWNGGALGDNDDFDASDPGAVGASPDISWDTDGWGVVTGGANVASINTLCTSGGDCIDWVATVVEAGVESCDPTSTEESTWGGVKSLFR